MLFIHQVMFDSLRSHGLQHTRLPCPSPYPWACANSFPLSRWCHATISSSVVPFSSCLQSSSASGSFLMSRLFESGVQSIGISASVLPMNIQDGFLLGLSVLVSLASPRDSQESLLQHHSAKPSLWSNSHIHDYWKNHTIQIFAGKVMSLLFNTLPRFFFNL